MITDDNIYRQLNILVSTEYFESIIIALKERKYQFVTCKELKKYNQHDRVVALTFDDGYADNVEYVFPLLQKHQIRATFFPLVEPCSNNSYLPINVYYNVVRTHIQKKELQKTFIHGSIKNEFVNTPAQQQWQFIQQLFPEATLTCTDTYMSPAHIKTMHDAGMEIGSHGVTHTSFYMPSITKRSCMLELKQSAQWLEACIQAPIQTFCFPYGHYKNKHLKWVKAAGYESAILTEQQDDATTIMPHYFRCNVNEGMLVEQLEAYNYLPKKWKRTNRDNILLKVIKKIKLRLLPN